MDFPKGWRGIMRNLGPCIVMSLPHRRELDKKPTLLISALPQHPNDYAALPANFGPRPRTVKMVCLASVSPRTSGQHMRIFWC